MKKVIKILFVKYKLSDEELICNTISKSNIEFTKKFVETQKDYISTLKTFVPDLIISDFLMSQLNGMTALLIRNDLSPDIPFIFVTAAQSEEIAVECMKVGADDYILKTELTRLGESIKLAINKKEIAKQKKIAEENIRTSEDRFREVAEHLGEWVWEVDKDGLFVYVSPFTKSLLGYTPEELIGKKHFYDSFDPDLKEDLKKAASIVLSKKESFKNFENPNVHKDGHIVFLETSGNPILDVEGNLTGYRGANTDITRRKYTEEMLKHSEEKFYKAFHNSPDAIIITRTSDGLFTEINESFIKISGYSREEIIGQTSIDLNFWININDRDRFLSTVKEAGRITDFEILLKTKYGDVRNVTLSGENYETKNETYIITIIRDITQQKLTENLIKENEEKYRSIYESSSIAILLTTTDGQVLSANKSACDLFNRTEEEICDLGRSGLVDMIDSRLTGFIDERSRTGKSNGILTFIKKNGEKFEAEVSSVIFANKEGVKLTSMVLRDLTEQNQSDTALKKSEARLRSYFELSGAGIAITSPIAGWMEVNDELCRMFGYTKEEIYKTTWTELTHPDDLIKDLENFNRVISGNIDGYSIDKRFIKKNGETIWTNLSVRAVKDQTGKVDYLVALLFDITERKSGETELIAAKIRAEENDKLKTAFLHNISHEIRTPLNAILGFGALLSEPGLPIETQASYLETIQEGSDQLLSIISSIVDISSAEAKILRKNITSFNLNYTLKSLLKQFLLKAPENSNSLTLVTGLNDEDSEIQTDNTKFIQIISNLLNNALKFTSNGHVEFGYSEKDSMIEFYVSDMGIGISPDQHKKIFESFYQVESTLDRKYGGTGLGLSICKAYVELLGGTIWLSSEPGIGSRFYFTVPFDKPESYSTSNLIDEKLFKIGKDASLVLLVAEDDEVNFNLINIFLKDQNVKIIWAKTGQEAVDICKSEEAIDLVLMDIRMPVMDGYTATRQVIELRPNLPVIAQTAFADEKEMALKSGCIDFIAKPFNKSHLVEIIKKHLPK